MAIEHGEESHFSSEVPITLENQLCKYFPCRHATFVMPSSLALLYSLRPRPDIHITFSLGHTTPHIHSRSEIKLLVPYASLVMKIMVCHVIFE